MHIREAHAFAAVVAAGAGLAAWLYATQNGPAWLLHALGGVRGAWLHRADMVVAPAACAGLVLLFG